MRQQREARVLTTVCVFIYTAWPARGFVERGPLLRQTHQATSCTDRRHRSCYLEKPHAHRPSATDHARNSLDIGRRRRRRHRSSGAVAGPLFCSGFATSDFSSAVTAGGVPLGDSHGEDISSSGSRKPQGKPLVDARQLSPEEVRRRWPETDFDVPHTMPEAVRTFFDQPTPRLICAGVMAVAALRMSCGVDLGLADALAIPAVAVGWSFQEWAIHKYLLHEFQDWLGYDVHNSHHDRPFYHVCVDPPDLVVGWTVAAACIFGLLLPPPLALTVLGAYMTMGGVYEWTHYIVHTRVVPRSWLGKEVKRHHTLHHLQDESCWLAFTVPSIDHLLGTVPPARCESKKSDTVAAGPSGAGDTATIAVFDEGERA